MRPENFELVKKFINQIVDTLDVSDRLAQVGLVQYSSSVRQEFPLGRYHTKKDIKAAVRNMSYMEKGTMTGAALQYLVDNSFSVSSGARPGAQKVGVVFTDGRSQDYINDAAKKAKELGRYCLLGPWIPEGSQERRPPGTCPLCPLVSALKPVALLWEGCCSVSDDCAGLQEEEGAWCLFLGKGVGGSWRLGMLIPRNIPVVARGKAIKWLVRRVP